MTITEKFWETTVKANLAGGYVKQHVEGPNYGIMSIEDENGNKGIYTFDKKEQKISLRKA